MIRSWNFEKVRRRRPVAADGPSGRHENPAKLQKTKVLRGP
jgi:hypothetical protein